MSTTTMIVECARCYHEYDVTSAMVKSGAWRHCPVCQSVSREPPPVPFGQRDEDPNIDEAA